MKGIKVYLLHMGYMWEPKTEADLLKETGGEAKDDPENSEDNLKRTFSYAVLISHPEAGWILYDTGICEDPGTGWTDYILENVPVKKDPEHDMICQLKLAGIEPSDVRHVITSHMHFDHMGNDALFADTADFYVSGKEADYTYKLVMGSEDRKEHGWVVREDVLMPRKRIHYLSGDTTLFEGVEVVELPGHTPGTLGLLVHLEEETLFFMGDAVKFCNNYEGEIPGGLYSMEDHIQTMEKIRKIESRYRTRLFFGHDEGMMKHYRMAPAFYE